MDKKSLTNRSNIVLFVAAVIGLVGVVNYLAGKFFVRADLTSAKTYTISKGTKRVLKSLDDLVTIKVFISEKKIPPHILPRIRIIKDFLSEYQAYGRGNLKVVYIDPSDDNDLKNEARSYGLQEISLQSFQKDVVQSVMCYNGLCVLYGDKKEIVPVLLNNESTMEYDLTSRILRLTRTEVKKVGFFFGNGPHNFTQEGMPPQAQERGPKQTYNDLKKGLMEQFEVVPVADLSKGPGVPADITTLVVAGPKSLTDREKFEIDQFVMRGGRLIALIDAVEVTTYMGVNAVKQAHNSSDLFSSYGAKVNQNIVADSRAFESISYQVNYGGFVLPVQAPYPVWVKVISSGFAKNNPAVAGLQQMVFMWPSSVDITLPKADSARVGAIPLVSTTRFAKAMEDNFDLNPQRDWSAYFKGALKSYDLGAVLTGEFSSFYSGKAVPSPAPGDESRTVLTKSPKTTVILIGDSDFLSDGTPRENNVFMTNLIEWLTLGGDLIDIRSKSVAERNVDPQLTAGTKTALNLFNIVVMPLLVIAIGIAVMLRRRNRTRKGAEA